MWSCSVQQHDHRWSVTFNNGALTSCYFIMFVAFFIRPFYKMMLGKKVIFEDMQSVVGVAELDISGSLLYRHMTGCGDVQQLKVHS